MIPTNPPVKNAIYKARGVAGNPRIKPNKNANFTSPKPIPFPRVSRNIPRKNKKDPTAEST